MKRFVAFRNSWPGHLVCMILLPIWLFGFVGMANALPINDSVVIDGRELKMQKFTLSCSFPANYSEPFPEFDGPPRSIQSSQLWRTVTREYTFHLVVEKSWLEYIPPPSWNLRLVQQHLAVSENRRWQ